MNADGSGVAAPSIWFVLPTYRELWLAAYFTGSELLDPEISGDAADPDLDGMSNLQEYLAGTNPRSASSLLSITQTGGGSGLSTNFVIVWQSASNRMYMLEAATNLLDGFTLELATDIPATPPLNVHTDHLGGAVQKFYRVRLKQ